MSRGPGGAVAVHRTPVRIHADPSRVLARPFVPGQDFVAHGASRAGLLLDRVLALPEPEVETVLAATLARFADRHRDLDAVLAAHYDLVAHRLADPAALSAARRRLIGA
ncbi:MAG TPA: hypothetical protein VFO65_03940, partial [Acidimicrobiales bacterium]|nr:hypothetical protein [Acidimicrobiales bacterium]